MDKHELLKSILVGLVCSLLYGSILLFVFIPFEYDIITSYALLAIGLFVLWRLQKKKDSSFGPIVFVITYTFISTMIFDNICPRSELFSLLEKIWHLLTFNYLIVVGIIIIILRNLVKQFKE